MITLRTIVERWKTRQHLVKQNTECPPINSLVCCRLSKYTSMRTAARRTVTVSVEDFGGEILWCATERVCGVRVFHVKLAQAEITQGDVSSVVQ